MQLTSVHNAQLQEIRKAVRAGRPLIDGTIAAEGPHLLEEAIGSCWSVEQILATAAARSRFSDILARTGAEIIEVSERAFHSISGTETNQGIIALLRPRIWQWSELLTGDPLVVVLDAVQDPGNVGTIIRSAEAFGASGLVLLDGCARISNGKLLRAAAGSLFRTPFLASTIQDAIRGLQENRLNLYALTPNANRALAEVDLRERCALIIGNEGGGISPELLPLAKAISIPTLRVESLNAGVACSIALFEARSQRAAR